MLSGSLHVRVRVCVRGASQWTVDNGAVDKPTVNNVTVDNGAVDKPTVNNVTVDNVLDGTFKRTTSKIYNHVC